MPLQRIQKLHADNQALVRVADNLRISINRILDSIPFLDGVLAENVALTTATSNVSHKLGRTPVGWLVVDKSADACVWRPSAADATILPLTASAAVTVKVWIF